MSKSNARECIAGVNCRVENCVFHTKGDLCSAAGIDVKNETATTKVETFCGTFAPLRPQA